MTHLKFEPMVEIVPEGKKGVAEIRHISVSKADSRMTALRAAVGSGGGDSYVHEGAYAQLYVGKTLMMSDTSMEKNSNYDLLRMASGNVLIAGLGIGMVLVPLLKSDKVTSVTVVEKYQDVVDLVSPHLAQYGDKLKVVCADIFEWKPEKGVKYETLYFDIWPTVTTDNLKEMETLHRRFSKCKAPGAWIESWMRQKLKVRKRREDKEAKSVAYWGF
jgi:hypothetical protein